MKARYALALGMVSLLAVASLSAQAPSNWTTIPVPANAIGQPNQIGTTVSIQTTNSVMLFSGITKEWTVLPVTSPSLIFQANDYLVIQDGNTLHGYASHTGAVDSITTPTAAPSIVSGPASSSWVTLVADGNSAWAFGAFHGQWESVTLSQPNPNMVASRLTALLQDGNTVYGVSAHHGTFVPVAADALASLAVVRESEVGSANSPGVLRGFSAQQNRWGVQVVPNSASFSQQAEYVLAQDANDIWAFSGISGTFDHYTATAPIGTVDMSEGVAAFQDGSFAVCYASGTGQFASRVVTNPIFTLDYHFAIVSENSTVFTPFSALTGAFGTPISGSFVLSSNDAIAYADGGGSGSFAYSPIRNEWISAPPLVLSSVDLVRDSVILGHAGGYEALSARHGQWVSLATTMSGNYRTAANSATFVALDGIGEIAHVFDARLNRWATVTGVAPLSINISRHTAMAHDGSTGFGFGQPSGEWYAEPLVAAPTSFRTSSSIGTILHGSLVSVYSVQGSLSYTGRYPEFTQAINLGNTLRLHQVAPPGSGAILIAGIAPTRLFLGAGFGYLYVDPIGSFSLPWPSAFGASGISEFAIPVPVDPSLRTVPVHLQNLVVPPSPGTPWLSSSVAPIVF